MAHQPNFGMRWESLSPGETEKMKSVKVCCLALFLAGLISGLGSTHRVQGEAAAEAATSLDLTTNGFVDQATFDGDRAEFEQVEGTSDGIGPLYNSNSCAACHANPITGVESLSTELRAGHLDDNGNFVPATVTLNDGLTTIPNRSLINDRAICPGIVMDAVGVAHDFQDTCIQERVPGTENIRAFRRVTNVLGDGFVEAIDDDTLRDIAAAQARSSGGRIHGEAIEVPVLESPGQTRIGRFGWKDQHSSLLSFVGDAYLNEMGVTNRLRPHDTTSIGKVTRDPEDAPDALGLADIDHFAQFVRGTKAPPRDAQLAASASAQAGEHLFHTIGCAACHVATIVTAPAGTLIDGGTFAVPVALGNKIIHPYSDFLLHDIDTGDGIVQTPPEDTANKLRTAPLWGLRVRPRHMHDLKSLTLENAIDRHGGEAAEVRDRFQRLSESEKEELFRFLNSL